jgi:hypothetical protein
MAGVCLQAKHNLEVTSVSCGTTLVYNPYFPNHKNRLGTKISEFVRTSVPSYDLKVPLPSHHHHHHPLVLTSGFVLRLDDATI